MSVPENPKQTKNPITLKIKFKSSSLEQFIERYSVDVSKSGIFIRTKEPLSVGTQLKFEFQLQDGSSLLSGEGTVVWNRAFDPARSSVAPGMGVRFEKLSADSQKVLERILAEKARRPDSNLESRFDAGVRALREGTSSEANLSSQATPKGDNGGFGDEPTRAMAADQVNKLAEAMQDEDPPTRQAPPPDLTDEVRRAMGAAAEQAKQLTPMTPMTATPSAPGAAGAPAANLGRTLIGQGFMMAPRTPGAAGGKDAPSSPGTAAPSVELNQSSQPTKTAAGPADSAKTPTASLDEQRARIADSHRTPTGGHKSASAVSASAEPITKPSATVPKPVEPKAPEPAAIPQLAEPPLAFAQPTPAAIGTAPGEGRRSSSPVGLIVGVLLLLSILGAVGYVFLGNGKLKLRGNTGTTTDPGPSGTPPTIPTDPAATGGPTAVKPPEVKPEPIKQPEPTSVPVKPSEPTEGVEVTTDPAGVHIEFGGKTFGPTPTRVPGLGVGSQISLSLRGYQEAKIRLRNAPEEGKPLFFKLTAIERLVEVNSSPKGADVLVDGKKVGKTPFVLKKLDTAKVHMIEVRRAGYAPWTHNVSDTESFVVKNRKEVLTLNPTLAPTDEGPKKGGHAPKREGAGVATPPAAGTPAPAPAEAPKAPEAAPPAPAPEPAKEAAPATP